MFDLLPALLVPKDCLKPALKLSPVTFLSNLPPEESSEPVVNPPVFGSKTPFVLGTYDAFDLSSEFGAIVRSDTILIGLLPLLSLD